MKTLKLSSELTLIEIQEILFSKVKIFLSDEIQNKIDESYKFLLNFSKDKVIYGINTGFGPMAQFQVPKESQKDLQYNIIRSHATGAGNILPEIYVRAAMLTRLYTFIRGKSGVHLSWVNQIVTYLNNDIYPIVPEHGSVGASGDLVQLAHIALGLIGEGEVVYKGKRCKTKQVLESLNIKPAKIYIREGLAMCNGTSFMTGIGLVNILKAKALFNNSLSFSVLMNEIASSYDDFASNELNMAKRHKGQRDVAGIMRKLMSDSKCLRKRETELYSNTNHGEKFNHKVQPYYSLRCIPQVLGPILEEIENTEKTLLNEFHSVCDNPVIDMETSNVYHGGNFHGDYISFQMDKLKIAITKLTMLSERQINYLFHDRINGILPPFVNMGVLGVNYGMQASQFMATSTTAECQTLSFPMSIHSISNNNDNQDIVSMGTNSALLTAKVIENSFQVISILAIGTVQAVDILKISNRISSNSQKEYNQIRNIIPAFSDDYPIYDKISEVVELLSGVK